MKKKILAALTICGLAAGLIAGCQPKDDTTPEPEAIPTARPIKPPDHTSKSHMNAGTGTTAYGAPNTPPGSPN